MRLSRWLFLLPFAIAAAGQAHADTRIFSVQTDREGVTITAIERNGQALPQVGQSGARTFFEIDEGTADVPCSNQLAFTASNGQRLEFIVDLCAHNWQVTLPLGIAQAPPASPVPPSTQPASVPASLTIYTDDPTVGIDEVNIGAQPVAIASTQGNAAVINLSPAQRSKCQQDLGLALSDGRRIARMVNVCTPSGSIVVALNDDAAAPPPPPIAGQPIGPPPPTAGQPVAPPPPVASTPPPAPGEIEVVEGLRWTTGSGGNRATLTYALPNSDQVEFFASCNRGSRQVEISLERSAPEVQPGASAPVTFTAGTYANTFTATGSDINALTGLSQPELTISTGDAFWTALIREEFLVVQTGSAPPYALSLKGSSAAARPFTEACNTPAFVGGPVAPGFPPPAGFPPPPGVPPSPGPVAGTGGDYPCSGEATLAAQRTNIESRLIVRNQSARPIQLFWLDYDGRRRPFLSLGPGETGVQPTFFTHPWVVADGSGRCIAIYYARNTDRTIVVGP